MVELIHLAADQHQIELDGQRLRLARLKSEEQKLLGAHYAEAISMTLLQKEQRRIMGERANAEGLIAALNMETEAMERPLDEALGRIEHCDEAFRMGSPKVRRDLCFALFNRLYVSEEGVVGSELATPYAQILDPRLQERLEADRAVIARTATGGGSSGDDGQGTENPGRQSDRRVSKL